MSITTWSGFLTELTRLIDGEDVSVSQVSVGTLTQIISMGEKRVYKDARTRYNQKAWGITTASNAATLPADFEASAIVHFGQRPLLPVSEGFIQEYLDNSPQGTVTRYFACAGDSLIFAPAVADATTVQGRYYYKLPALDATTLPANALFLAHEELFIYSALAESAPFFGQDPRIPMWLAIYQKYMDLANSSQQMAAYSAGRMQRRPSTTLMR